MPMNAIVVGMPRSGTSMLAGIFGRRGFFVADGDGQLREGDEANPGGYWEAEDLIDRNVEVFGAVGYPHHNTWLFDAMTDEIATRLMDVGPLDGHRAFVDEYDAHSPWLWKDPRLCYTLAYWWRIVDRDRTRVLVIDRDPEAIYRSFVRLKWRDPSTEAREELLGRVEHHHQYARKAIEANGIPHTVLAFSDFAERPDAIADELSRILEMSVDASELGFVKKLDHSGFRGRISTVADRIADRMPGSVRKMTKALVPRSILKGLFPERDF